MSMINSATRLGGYLCALLASGCMLLAAQRAAAQTCQSAADCPKLFTCKTVGTTACDSVKTCPPGQTCPAQPPCMPMDIKECTSPVCAADADCPKDMVCYARTIQMCADPGAPACKPGAACPQPVEPPIPLCTAATEHSCVPRYIPACKQDADCGAGFTCDEVVQLACSGGGASAGSCRSLPDGGTVCTDAAPPAPAQCTSTPTGMSRCNLKETTCKSATDCPSGFTCEDNPLRARCATSASIGSGGASGTAGAPALDAGVVNACPGQSTAPAKVCLPPYYQLVRGTSKGVTLGSGTGTPTAAGHGTTTTGTAGTSGPSQDTSASKKASSGCSVTSTGSTDALGLLLFAMLALRKRRPAPPLRAS